MSQNFTRTLDVDTVILIHDRMIAEDGGLQGIHFNKLEGALSRIDSHVFYAGLNDLYEIAALYGIAIAQGHPFNDANKRTAMASMIFFLRLNGIICQPSNEIIPDFIEGIAKKLFNREEIAQWLKNHTL